RQGRGRGVGGDQSVRGGPRAKSPQSLARQRRRIDQPAEKRAGGHDENARRRGREYRQDQAATVRGLQGGERGGRARAAALKGAVEPGVERCLQSSQRGLLRTGGPEIFGVVRLSAII